MFRTLRDMGAFMGLIHRTLFAPLYLALQYWNRKSELSADRCGMIITSEEIVLGQIGFRIEGNTWNVALPDRARKTIRSI